MQKPLCCRCVYMFNCGNTGYKHVMRENNICHAFEPVRKHDNEDYNKSVIEQSDYILRKSSLDCPEYRTDIFI